MAKIMGILNITPDSFFDGGKFLTEPEISKQINKMVQQGVDIIDIGGESSRPYAKAIDFAEEKKRILPVIKMVHREFPNVQISVDTTKAKIAREALLSGAHIINDISAGRKDPKMLSTACEFNSKFVIMHMQGEPSNMQINPGYNNVIDDINKFFEQRIKTCLEFGLSADNLILDPGIGFGKSPVHNFSILANLEKFLIHGLPLLIGLSMKSFLGGEITSRLVATITLNSFAVLKGASIIRVHHVSEAIRSVKAIQKLPGNLVLKY